LTGERPDTDAPTKACGERPLVLPLPHESAVTDARVRLFVAALVTPAALVLLSDPTPLRVVVGIGGLIASAAFVAGARRVRAKTAAVTEEDCLVLDPDGVSIRTSGTERRAPWKDVLGVDLEPDAATLSLTVRDAEPMIVAPGYGGLGTVALHELLERYRLGANRRDRGYHSAHGE